LDALVEQGRKTLTAIPGMRQVFSGWASSEMNQYRLCCRIQLSHSDAISNLQSHSEYIYFFNQLSRLIDSEKISITFAPTLSNTEFRFKELVDA